MKFRIVFAAAIAFCVLGSQNAAAETDLGMKGIGVRAGLVSPDNLDATIGLGVLADLGTITPNLALEAYGDYWSQSEGFQFVGEIRIRDIAFGARTKYLIPVRNTKIQPYVGGGLGLHMLSAKVSIEDQDLGGVIIPGSEVEETSTELGLDLGGGASTPVGKNVNLLGEVYYGIVSDVSQLSLRFGAVYLFGQ